MYKNHGSWWFEGIFLNHEEIEKLFLEQRPKAPYENMTKIFHVTVEYMPENEHKQFYGKEVEVHIIAYKDGKVISKEGGPTGNEGFKVTLKADDAELQAFLDSIIKNYHVTGSFEDDAVYTNYIDFSDGKKLDVTVRGVYGCGYEDDFIDFG